MEIFTLEDYYVKPSTIDSWLGGNAQGKGTGLTKRF
jgi:hypothetical protein